MKRFSLLLCCLLLVAVGCAKRQSPLAPPSSTSSTLASPSQVAVSSSPSPAFQGRLVQLSYRGGVVSPALHDVEVRLGEKVRIELDSDRAEELHVHAYDQKVDVVPGKTAVLEFIADIPGSFEVELETGKVTLFELTVK